MEEETKVQVLKKKKKRTGEHTGPAEVEKFLCMSVTRSSAQ